MSSLTELAAVGSSASPEKTERSASRSPKNPKKRKGDSPPARPDDVSVSDSVSEFRGRLASIGVTPKEVKGMSLMALINKTRRNEPPKSSITVNAYHAINIQTNKLESSGHANADVSDELQMMLFCVMDAEDTDRRIARRANEALEVMCDKNIAPGKRMEHSITKMIRDHPDTAHKFIELSNYCHRMQLEGPPEAKKKYSQNLITLISNKCKELFADGLVNFETFDPEIVVDAKYVEELVKTPPKTPRKRLVVRPPGKKTKESDECSQTSSGCNTEDDTPFKTSKRVLCPVKRTV